MEFITNRNPEAPEKVVKKEQLNEKLTSLLNTQKDSELYNHHLYKTFSNYFYNKGLHKLSKYYNLRSEEEKSHHDIIVNRLKECNVELIYHPQTFDFDKIKDNMDAINKTIDAEFKTTKAISDIIKVAFEENDYKIAYWLMSTLISEQHEEEYMSILAKNISEQETDWITIEQSILDAYEG